MTVPFEIMGQNFIALNGGPLFKLNPSISFFVNCKSENEVQTLWDKLSDGGKVLMELAAYPFSEKYGWIEDKYGVSWQLIKPQGEIVQRIVPSLLFVQNVCGKAEEAINFYSSIFSDSKTVGVFRNGANQEPDKEGTVAYASFSLSGQSFAAMDSAHSHNFSFNEAISFMVNCESQTEVDYFWDRLTEGGEGSQCGWLKDKYGVSWQVTPTVLGELMSNPDPKKSKKVMEAMLKMRKLDIETLRLASEDN
jgi:predicted 3-demethylubiquinone-9 3-methyltransferase (glyoxalase superfamily)